MVGNYRGSATLLIAASAALMACFTYADDAVGVFKVDSDGLGPTIFSMPFMPAGGADPNSFLSGNFIGEGPDIGDVLYHMSVDGAITGAVYYADAWRGLSDGLVTSLRESEPGDAFAFVPGSEREPFSFFVYGHVPRQERLDLTIPPGFGFMAAGYPVSVGLDSLPSGVETVNAEGSIDWRIPAAVSNALPCAAVWARLRPYSGIYAGAPSISGMSVAKDGLWVSMNVDTDGHPADILTLASTNGYALSGWRHADRLAASAAGVRWSDSRAGLHLAADGALFYLVADASRDSDGDGMPDGLEKYVFGTSPSVADTDGDGVNDGLELAWGTNPLRANAVSPFSWVEGFELPTVCVGAVSGQNGWRVQGDVEAVVTSDDRHSGISSLRMRIDDGDVGGVVHDVDATSDVVWSDINIKAGYVDELGEDTAWTAAYAVGNGGVFLARDGLAVRTNTSVKVECGSWIRVTCRLDYGTHRWDCYLDGVLLFSGLSMGADTGRLSSIEVRDGCGNVDDIVVTSQRPLGLSSDGDLLPDEWEFLAFGTLDRDGSGDADNDGLSDIEEWRLGTSPLSADTDGDGIGDRWEVEHGMRPVDASDARLDFDGDGFDNLHEYQLGLDPRFYEPDPRRAMPGLRAVYVLTEGRLGGIPDFTAYEPYMVSVAETVDFSDVTWPEGIADRADDFACRITGFVLAPESGRYTFYLTSDDAAELLIDGVRVIADESPHGARESMAETDLVAGWHPIDLRYYENSGVAKLSLHWSGPGFGKELVPGDAFCHYPENLEPRVSASVSGSEWVEHDTIRITASAYDIDGQVLSLSLYDGDRMIDTMNTTTGVFVVRNAASGVHGYKVVAIDDGGSVGFATCRVPVDIWPDGYQHGVPYSASMTSVLWMKGLSIQRTFTTNGIVPSVSFASSFGPWAGFPIAYTNDFTAEFQGAFYAPESGRYTLSLRSDDGSRLWVDGALAIDHYTRHSMTEKTASVPLSVGMHEFMIQYYENTEYAGLELGWTRPDGVTETVPASRLFHRVSETDSDGDGIPDWWERLYDLDCYSASDAGLDYDSDGVDNRAEYLAGSNPRKSDTDSDGFPDALEIASGTIPYVADAMEDADGDGLNNLEEYRIGTNPSAADTDGDGCPDSLEIRNSHSDPLVPDINWTSPSFTGAVIKADTFVGSSGAWRTELDGSVYAVERAGSLIWRLVVPSEGADALALRIAQHEFYSDAESFDLSLFVDGVFISRQIVNAPYGSPEYAYFFLPEISAGDHEFRLVWHNWESNTFLQVRDLRFVNFAGPDEDRNGVSDWLDNRNASSSRFDELPYESLVSPLCVEGCDLWRDVLEIGAEYVDDGSNAVFATVKTIGDGFYVDVPLAESGNTRLYFADRTLSNVVNVCWRPLDVFSGEYLTNALAIRVDDALRIAGSGRISIFVAEGTEWEPVADWTQSDPSPYRFSAPGLYLVEARCDAFLTGADVGYAMVEVVESRFPKRNPAIMMDYAQTLLCPGLSPRNLLEHDASLQVSAEPSPFGGVELKMFTNVDRDLGLVSRLDEDGPISDAVQVTPVWADNGEYYHVIRTYPDGSQLVEISLLFGAMAENMSVELEIFVAGVSFEDGSRAKTLTLGDFDENGRYVIRFVKARGVTTSVCHRTYVYQDGRMLYTNE